MLYIPNLAAKYSLSFRFWPPDWKIIYFYCWVSGIPAPRIEIVECVERYKGKYIFSICKRTEKINCEKSSGLVRFFEQVHNKTALQAPVKPFYIFIDLWQEFFLNIRLQPEASWIVLRRYLPPSRIKAFLGGRTYKKVCPLDVGGFLAPYWFLTWCANLRRSAV